MNNMNKKCKQCKEKSSVPLSFYERNANKDSYICVNKKCKKYLTVKNINKK